MRHLSYLGVLLACLLCVVPLAVVVRRTVLGAPKRLGLTLLTTFVVFTAWDLYAIHHDQWQYAAATTTGLLLPGTAADRGGAVLPRHPALHGPHLRDRAPGPGGAAGSRFPRHRIVEVVIERATQRTFERGWGRVVTYTVLAVVGVLVSIALDLWLLRTRLLSTRAFWFSYAIILGFQLLVNGTLTGFDIVTYTPSAITGLRIVHAPSRTSDSGSP